MTAPQPPQGLQATPDLHGIKLRWRPNPDAVRYTIYYSTCLPMRTTCQSVEVQQTAGELNGLPIASEYHVAVSASNAAGEESELSPHVSTRTLEPAPAPPVYLAAAPGENCLDVTWNQVVGSTGYTLYFAASSPVTTESAKLEVPAPTEQGAITVRLDALFNDHEYFLAVSRTTRDGQESALSSEISATPTAPPPPPAPPTP